MKRSITLIALIVGTLVGSLFMMQTSNMFFADIINVGVSMSASTALVTMSSLAPAIFFVMLVLFVLRLYRHPDCQKGLTHVYSIILIVVSAISVLCTVLASLLVYRTFVGNHPFPGYSIVYLLLNLSLLGCGVFWLLRSRKLPDDEGHIKKSFGYVMRTIGWFLFICLVFNRLGTFLSAPVYLYWRNFDQTFPFYLYLLVPLFLGVFKALQVLGIAKRKLVIAMAIVGIVLNVGLVTCTAIMGINDTTFIASLSQAMPLERAAAKPVELPIHLLANLGVAISLFVTSRKPKGE